MSSAPAEVACPECGKVGTRQMHGGAGLLFKGSGFYLTDYGKNAHRATERPRADGKASEKSNEKTSEKVSEKASEKADVKTEAKAETKPKTEAPKAESKPAKKPKSE